MKKIFIAYGDNNCAYSLKRIGHQAKKLNIFDEIILYTPDDLPDYFKKTPLMQYSYGGGYWAWKPFIINETLKKFDDGDIVCYVDAGCTLKKSIEWTIYFELMRDYDMLCFKYRDEYPEWQKFGTISTKIKHWAKKQTLSFLDNFVGDDNWREKSKVLGGFLFFKNKNNPIIEIWLKITLNNPEIILDPTKDEMSDQYPFFALHKHEQVLLVALTYKFKDSCLILPETCETCGENVAVFASRIRTKDYREYIINRAKYYCRHILGDSLFNLMKSVIKK